MRAFCSKHSTSQGIGSAQRTRNLTRIVGDDSLVTMPPPATVLPNKIPKLRISRKNKEKNITQVDLASSVSNEVAKDEASCEHDALDINLSPEEGDIKSSKDIDIGVAESDNSLPDTPNLISLLKKVM